MNIPDFEPEYQSLLHAIRKVVPPSMKIYLVGGAVRDILLGRQIRDFDFCVEGLVRPIGKSIANELGGAYYVLDDEREMVRIIIDDEHKGQFDIDIALISGDDIESDLRERDFTFNAMAVEIGSETTFVDPLGGLQDLEQKRLRMCSSDSLNNDPMRALRAIRMSLEFDLNMDDELLDAMSKVPSRLSVSSMERYRDEMFKIIRLYKNGKAIQLYKHFNFLSHLFPGWDKNDSVIDSKWIENTDKFALLLITESIQQKQLDDFASFAGARLGNYKETLHAFFDKPLALYHNRLMLTIYTSIVRTLTDEKNEIQSWCSRLAFSSSETNYVLSASDAYQYLKTVENVTSYSDVEIYRYFQKFKESGIAGLILFLSDLYELQDIPHAYRNWCEKVVFVQNLIAAYFTRYMEVIAPKPFLSGHDIQNLTNLPAGPVIGSLKDALLEAQISGAVLSRAEAESFIRQQTKHFL